MQYFAKALARPIRHYQKDDELRVASVHRLCSLLRLKYANNAAAISQDELFTAVDKALSASSSIALCASKRVPQNGLHHCG